jgi:hypothetical protein
MTAATGAYMTALCDALARHCPHDASAATACLWCGTVLLLQCGAPARSAFVAGGGLRATVAVTAAHTASVHIVLLAVELLRCASDAEGGRSGRGRAPEASRRGSAAGLAGRSATSPEAWAAFFAPLAPAAREVVEAGAVGVLVSALDAHAASRELLLPMAYLLALVCPDCDAPGLEAAALRVLHSHPADERNAVAVHLRIVARSIEAHERAEPLDVERRRSDASRALDSCRAIVAQADRWPAHAETQAACLACLANIVTATQAAHGDTPFAAHAVAGAGGMRIALDALRRDVTIAVHDALGLLVTCAGVVHDVQSEQGYRDEYYRTAADEIAAAGGDAMLVSSSVVVSPAPRDRASRAANSRRSCARACRTLSRPHTLTCPGRSLPHERRLRRLYWSTGCSPAVGASRHLRAGARATIICMHVTTTQL